MATVTGYNKTQSDKVRVANLDALFALAAPATIPPPGTIVHVGYAGTTINGTTATHFGSVWRVTPGGVTFEPLPEVPIIFDSVASMRVLEALCKSGGAWNSRMTFDNLMSLAACTPSNIVGGSGRLEFLWSADAGAFWLKPGVSTNFEAVWGNTSTNQTLTNAAYTTITFDTVLFDGLGGVFTPGTSQTNFTIPFPGRYMVSLRWSPSNDDASPYLMTFYNYTTPLDYYDHIASSVVASWPFTRSQEIVFSANDILQVKIYKQSSNSQTLTRAYDLQHRARLMIRYLGWR